MPATGRNFNNLIHALTERPEGTLIPEIYRKWSAISLIACALQKNVWYDFGEFIVWPNLFIILVGNPGSGKSLSQVLPFGKVAKPLIFPIGIPVEEIKNRPWEHFGLKRPLFVLSDKITPEQLIVDMKYISRIDLSESTFDSAKRQAAITLWTSEFGSLMNQKRSEFIQIIMTDLWDARDAFSDRTKTSGRLWVPDPCLNWVADATPQQFLKNMPEDADDQGLLSRCIVVNYSGDSMPEDIFYTSANEARIEHMTWDLAQVAALRGRFSFEPQFVDEVRRDVMTGLQPRPSHPVMQIGYNTRRKAHLMKVAMAVSAAKRSDLVITSEDWAEARELLVEAEQSMPEIFNNFKMSDAGRAASDLASVVEKAGAQGMSQNDFYLAALSRVRSPAEVNALVDQMKKAGLISIGKGRVRPGKLNGYAHQEPDSLPSSGNSSTGTTGAGPQTSEEPDSILNKRW